MIIGFDPVARELIVDLDDGSLGPATALRSTCWHDHHPTGGGVIAGRRLPYWREARQLAESAHRAFSDYVIVGWDIAILADGAILVEGNSGPDLDIIQRVTRQPIGRLRTAELLALHLAKAV